MYIIMAIQEEGSEIRITDFDETNRGFRNASTARSKLAECRENYPEFRRIWVEELKDSEYWASRVYSDMDEFGNDLNEYC